MSNSSLPANAYSRLHWVVLVCALVFVCSQSLAAAHVHSDAGVDESCVICLHGQDTSASIAVGYDGAAIAVSRCFSVPAHQCWMQLDPPCSYLTRAPPIS